MKKTLIGSVLLFAGVLQTIGVLISSVIYLPHLSAWSTSYPSKLLFAIMAGKSRFNDGANGLGLGLFFVFGIALTLLGLGILLYEFFKKEHNVEDK